MDSNGVIDFIHLSNSLASFSLKRLCGLVPGSGMIWLSLEGKIMAFLPK